MGLDLLIRNGTVVDGSGAARYRADVGITDGRIVEIGRIRSAAERTIDADGLIVAPGFIDGHTHMDAQVAWDRIGSCSCWHGVTSVIMGNCGFALAPCKPEDREWYRPLPDRGRGHPDRGDAGRHRLDLGDLPGVPGHRRPPAQGDQLRRLHRPFGAAHVRHGQAGAEREGHRGRSRPHGGGGAGGDPRRRHGVLQLARRRRTSRPTTRRWPAASPTGRRSIASSAPWRS